MKLKPLTTTAMTLAFASLLTVNNALAGQCHSPSNLEKEAVKALDQACSAAKLPGSLCSAAASEVIRVSKRFFSEHPKIKQSHGVWEMPLYYDSCQKSRLSVNFGPLKRGYDHLVQVNFMDVKPEDLSKVRVTFLADKRARNDKPRSGPMRHGDTIKVNGATSRDRGYYVARLEYHGGREAFFLRNPHAKLRIKPLKSWKKGQKNLPKGSVVIYQHADFKGRFSSFKPGRYNIRDLGIGNDALSSLEVPKGRKVRLYEHANFKGRSIMITSDTKRMGKWNDRVSSLIVQ